MKELAVEFDDVDLSGQRLPTPLRLVGHRSESRWWITRKWQGHERIPYCVPRADGWLEAEQPRGLPVQSQQPVSLPAGRDGARETVPTALAHESPSGRHPRGSSRS